MFSFLFSYLQGTASAQDRGGFEAPWKQVHITLFLHAPIVNQFNCCCLPTQLLSEPFGLGTLSVSLCICDNQRSCISGFWFEHTPPSSGFVILPWRKQRSDVSDTNTVLIGILNEGQWVRGSPRRIPVGIWQRVHSKHFHTAATFSKMVYIVNLSLWPTLHC